MEKPHFEAQFRETKKKLESSQVEINKFLKYETLDARERVRLTRVLQLVERYQPEREVEEPRVNKWKNYLESAYRFLPSQRKLQRQTEQKPIENISAHSYLLAEKTIASLRDLRRVDFQIEQEKGFSEDEILDQERPNRVEREETLDTSLTLEYEKKNWGVERICLDGIQNHLPSDSKGERVWVRCLVGDKWVSLTEARQQKDKIKAVRFTDDGVGFDVKNLSLLYSTKAEEKESRGQFGEGMKMMAAAALREGLEPEMESQDWRAKPTPKEVRIYDTRNKKEQVVQQLSFQVDHLAGEPMMGSRTTFHKPTEVFIDEVMKMEKKVLALRENYHPIFVGSAGEIVDREPGGIFVKGIYVCNAESLFSYNFDDVETNRDRNSIVSGGVERRIAQIVQEISDKRLVKTLLQKSILKPGAVECSYYGLEAQHPSVWVEGFYETFGKDAVLDTEYNIPDTFRDRPLERIKLPSSITNLLWKAGIKTDREATPDYWEETIPTSLTLEYGKDIWNEERILLDAIQNHLPRDSGGSGVDLRFKTKDGKWHSFSYLPGTKDDQVEAIKIFDDGRGYDSRLLGFFHSTKGDGESAGKFGEGLKMLCVASLRKGVDVVLRSQNWSAKPRALRQEIDGQQIDQLVFDVQHAAKELNRDGDNGGYQSSSTTFVNPTVEMLNEFRQINKKVLAIDNIKPIETTSSGDVLTLDGGMMYVRQILIPGDHNLLCSYHFPKLEIKNRDRSYIEQQELIPAVSGVWSRLEHPEAIKSFLIKANLEAQKGGKQGMLEFAMDFTPKDPESWKKIFKETFGFNVTIRNVHSENFDMVHQNQHSGLETLSFPPAVYNVLRGIGLPTTESVSKEMSENEAFVPRAELTPTEIDVLETLKALDAYLPDNRESDIIVYSLKDPNKIHGLVSHRVGYSNGQDIHLLRDILSNFTEAADTYIHEKAHHNTGGAKDASSGFRDYLTLALAKLAIEQLKKVRPELIKTES